MRQVLAALAAEWPGADYHLLAHNCNHFCDELARRLGVGPIPSWVNRFATAADTTVEFSAGAYSTMRQVGQEMQEALSYTVSSVRSLFGGEAPSAAGGPGPGAGGADDGGFYSAPQAAGRGGAGGAAEQQAPQPQQLPKQHAQGGGGSGGRGQTVGGQPPVGPPQQQLQQRYAAAGS